MSKRGSAGPRDLPSTRAVSLQTEIAAVQSIGVPADKIFYSSPCKPIAHIKYAASHGVRLMAFDNEVELGKVARSHPHARWVPMQDPLAPVEGGLKEELGRWLWGGGGPKDPLTWCFTPCRMLLGIAADSSPSAHPSMMFGATLKSCRRLLEAAKEQAVEVVGIRYGTLSFFSQGAHPVGHPGGELLLGPLWGRLACREGLCRVGWAVSLWMFCGRCRGAPVRIAGSPCPLTATWDGPALLNGDCAPSFHLGSCSLEPQGFAQAVAEAQLAFDMGTELGYRMHLLDIGGGFPGTEDARAQFEEVHGSQGWLWAGRERGRSWLPALSRAARLSSRGQTSFPHPDRCCDKLCLGHVFPGGLRGGDRCETRAILCHLGLHSRSQHHRQGRGSCGAAGL